MKFVVNETLKIIDIPIKSQVSTKVIKQETFIMHQKNTCIYLTKDTNKFDHFQTKYKTLKVPYFLKYFLIKYFTVDEET